jgi:hypothetical protein
MMMGVKEQRQQEEEGEEKGERVSEGVSSRVREGGRGRVSECVSGKKKKKKQRVLSEGVSVEQLREGWTQCTHLVLSKRRLCNIGRCV